jgi:hypothetical protein
MNDFRGPLPLEDRDFAEVRRNVMSKIGRRPVAIPITLAAAAVLALIIILLPQPRITVPPPHRAPAVRINVEPTLSRLEPGRSAPAESRRHVPPPRVEKSAGSPPPDSEITMNIETADPNVRIIWIVR